MEKIKLEFNKLLGRIKNYKFPHIAILYILSIFLWSWFAVYSFDVKKSEIMKSEVKKEGIVGGRGTVLVKFACIDGYKFVVVENNYGLDLRQMFEQSGGIINSSVPMPCEKKEEKEPDISSSSVYSKK